MKKILISALFVFGIVLSASAQGKKEMLESISALQTGQTTLGAKVDQMNALLLTFTQSIATLQAENATLRERLVKLEADLAALREQGAGAAAAPGQAPTALRTAADSMQAVFIAYYKSKTPEEASQYVLDAQRVKPLMVKYYDEVKNWEVNTLDWNPDRQFEQVRANVYFDDDTDMCLVKTPSGYKVDWEASVKYNPYTEAQMKAQPNKVFELKIRVEKNQNYDNDYWNAYAVFTDDYFFYFYARKTSPQAARLDKYIKQKVKPAIVKVKWVPGDNSDFELVEFVCAGCSKYQLNTQHASSLNR